MDLYRLLVLVELLAAPLIFLTLLFRTAPYGRHAQRGWGPVLNGRLAWVLMELPAVVTIAIAYLYFGGSIGLHHVIFLLIWEFHYVYRTFYFPMKMKSVRHDFPLILVIFAVIFNVINGWANGLILFQIRPVSFPDYFFSGHFIVGCIIFALGFYLHFTSDRIILSLRKDGEKRYVIPRGGLFKHVTNPNYLGEFIQWTGWAVLTWSWAGAAFAIFTLANLLPRAISNHRWYHRTFDDYPKERKIFLPGIF